MEYNCTKYNNPTGYVRTTGANVSATASVPVTLDASENVSWNLKTKITSRRQKRGRIKGTLHPARRTIPLCYALGPLCFDVGDNAVGTGFYSVPVKCIIVLVPFTSE